MNKFIVAAIISTIMLTGFYSCAPKTIMQATQADADRGVKEFPGLTLEQLKAGQNHFETLCTQCHGPKKPSAKDAVGWAKTVNRMAGKVKEGGEKKSISLDQQKAIVQYLATMGSASSK